MVDCVYVNPQLARHTSSLSYWQVWIFLFRVMLHGTIRNDVFSATHRSNIGTTLQPFETISQKWCNVSYAKNRESSRVTSPLRA